MSDTKPTPEEWIDLIARRAGELREAGVRRLELEGAIVELEPPTPEIRGGRAETEPEDPFEDPHTYQGGRVPSISRPRGS